MMTRIKDRTGEKYNWLTFVRRKDVMWELACDCGTLVCYNAWEVVSGVKRSCGCRLLKNMKRNELVGMKFGRLTFVRPTSSKRRGVIWELLCECGSTVYSVSNRVASGHTSSCGCLKKEIEKANMAVVGGNTRKYPPRITSARLVWKLYKECSFEEFMVLSQLPCVYCWRLPYKTYNAAQSGKSTYKKEDQRINGDFTYNGLDRIDSSKGHTIDNVVPCCYPCNKAKSAMTLEQFILHVENMYNATQRFRELLKSGVAMTPTVLLFRVS